MLSNNKDGIEPPIPSVSKRKKFTLLNNLPNEKCETFSENVHNYVWMAEGLIYHMTFFF